MQHRAMVEGQALAPLRRKHRLGKEGGVFVVADDVRGACETNQPEPLPVIGVFREGDRDTRPVRSEGRIRHNVRFEDGYVRNARIFAAVAGMRPHFVWRLRLERKTEPLASKSVGLLAQSQPSQRARCCRRRRSADRAAAPAAACARPPDSELPRLRSGFHRVRGTMPTSARRSPAADRATNTVRSRQVGRRNRLVAGRYDLHANAAPIDAIGNDPECIGPILALRARRHRQAPARRRQRARAGDWRRWIRRSACSRCGRAAP